MSVVIPVYKVEKYLPETIESIISQDFDDFEAIFVDDGSPDSCPALLDSAQEKFPDKIRVIHLKENRGTHFARKTGVLAARGDFLTFLDGDDTFLPGAFSTIIKEMENNPVDILRFNVAYQTLNKNAQYDFQAHDRWFNMDFEPVFKSPNILKHIFLEIKAPHNTWATIYPMPLVKKAFTAMTDDLRIIFAEDLYEMFILAHFAQSLKKLNVRLYNYRLGSGICFQNTSRELIDVRLISAKNIDKSFQQFPVHPVVADFAKEYPKKMVRDMAHLWLAFWGVELEKLFADSPDSKLCQYGKNCIYNLNPISRAEKLGRIILFPLKKLRSLVWKIEKNPTGKILLKPARFLWNCFYKCGRAGYRFLLKIKS